MNKKILVTILALLAGINGIAIARGGGGGGGGHFGGGGGGFHGGGFGGGGFHGGGFGGGYGRSYGGYSGRSFGGYNGGYGRSAGFSGPRSAGFTQGRSTGFSRSTTHFAKPVSTSHAAGARAAGTHAGAKQSVTNAHKASGLNKQNAANKQSLQQHQKAAQQKIAHNSKLSHMNKQNAQRTVNGRNWGHWHNGPFGWNPLWWGLGFGLWPLGVWGFGWNWLWWGNTWWFGGFPWFWWQDYNPDYFADVVYPQYVAEYQGVSGAKAPNYWDITNNSDDVITVNAKRGDTNMVIQSGETRRVFHTPNNNKFSAQIGTETQEYNIPETKVTIQPGSQEGSDEENPSGIAVEVGG